MSTSPLLQFAVRPGVYLAASRPESLFRYWLIASDLPDPRPQIPVADRWGRVVVHADLGYEEWKIAVEYEGGSTRSATSSAATSVGTR